MKATRKPPSKHNWMKNTNSNEIPSWTLNQCLAYLSVSESTQIKKLPGGRTAMQSKELVYQRLVILIGERYKVTSNRAISPISEKHEINSNGIVYANNLIQALIDNAFPFFKSTRVIMDANDSKEKLYADIAILHENALQLIQMINRFNRGMPNNQNVTIDLTSLASQFEKLSK